MSHGYILTDQDKAPEGITAAEEAIELAVLGNDKTTGPTDFTWDHQDQQY
ncbi:hypothetical protein ACRB8A_19680 (plasmid) [Arthrobacter sp. G.S.26]